MFQTLCGPMSLESMLIQETNEIGSCLDKKKVAWCQEKGSSAEFFLHAAVFIGIVLHVD